MPQYAGTAVEASDVGVDDLVVVVEKVEAM